MNLTDSTPFTLVTYMVARDTSTPFAITCAIVGNHKALAAVRTARAQLRANKLHPLKLVDIERIQ